MTDDEPYFAQAITKNAMSKITHKVSRLVSFGASVVGYRGGTEEPAYSIVAQVGPVEIRRYDERLAADTAVDAEDEMAARRRGFRILADYIFGNNQAGEIIAMTAPVAQSSQQIVMSAPVGQLRLDRGWRIRFFLPAELTEVKHSPERRRA